METKKDIYNLWVQYTTKNDEQFFRQFVSGFVTIWQEQLQLDFDNVPLSINIKRDLGPHIKRLPEELIPAIQKFLIIARTDCEKKNFSGDRVVDTELLLKCLTIICRHFDNIALIARSNFITCSVDIVFCIVRNILQTNHQHLDQEIIKFIKTFSEFLEVVYDPYLTWRNFLKGNYTKFDSEINLHAEIVPFIYGCFETQQYLLLSEIGCDILSILGAIISGSRQNGQRAICPATVKIIINIISTWECDTNLRKVALNCLNIMLIVLQKSSPEQRQIEVVTVMQHYLEAIAVLQKTEHFKMKPFDDNFEISNTEQEDKCIDVNALLAIISNIEYLLMEKSSKYNLCKIMIECNFLSILVGIANTIKTWDTDKQTLLSAIVKNISCICYTLDYKLNSKLIRQLFDSLKSAGKPSQNLITQCIHLVHNPDDELFINCNVINEIIIWLPDMGEKEQIFVAKNLLEICTLNLDCKILACNHKIINSISLCLANYKKFNSSCICDLIKLMEELGKHTIQPVELKNIFKLFTEENQFPYRIELLDTIANISSYSVMHNLTNKEFWNIQRNEEGITVPDIEQWSIAGPPNGFIFYTWIRLEKLKNEDEVDDLNVKFYRQQLFHLLSNQGTGFEIFITKNGSLILGAITKKEFYSVTASNAKLFDGKWHSIIVSVVPSKRPFSYYHVNMYKDNELLLSTSLKTGNPTEKFIYCSIGAPPYHHYKENLATQFPTSGTGGDSMSESNNNMKGLFPSLFEKALPSIVTQAPNYFTLPLRGFSSPDPHVKCIGNGLQDNVFGKPCCIKGQIGCTLLAESSYNIKNILDLGLQIASSISQETDIHDQSSKIIFCYSPGACSDNICIDLSNGKKYNGHVIAKFNRIVSIQDAVNSIGGIQTLLPFLECFTEQDINLNDESKLWETADFPETKCLQNPIAYLLYMLKNYLPQSTIQESNENISLIGLMVLKCNSNLLDVNVLMSMQILVETVMQHKEKSNLNLLEHLYDSLLFNFKIWSKASFQIIIGHIQYIQTLVKTDRKHFRKKYGIQFFLDTIRQYFITPNNIPLDDAKAIRLALLEIIRYYIHKEINIKEIGILLSFLATNRNEIALIEVLEMLTAHMETNCKDQIFLLMLEPQTAELLYCLLLEKTFSCNLQKAVLKLIWCLLFTKWVSNRHKSSLYLYENSVKCQSMYPGLLNFMLPFRLGDDIILTLFDQMLSTNSSSGYCGVIYLLNHLEHADLNLKLEVSKRLITAVFTKQNSSILLAQQLGWQHAITKLFVKKSIGNITTDNNNRNASDGDFISFDDTATATATKTDANETTNDGDEDNQSIKSLNDNIIDTESNKESLTDKDDLSIHSASTISDLSNLNVSQPTSTLNLTAEQQIPVLTEMETTVSKEEQLVYLLTNIIFTILWRGVGMYEVDSWKKEGQIVASINLLALNNELYCSHLVLRLKLLEMTVQACLIDLSDDGAQNLNHQQNAAQLLRMVYDLVVLDQNKDDLKKCSTKLLDGVLALLDSLMVFQDTAVDDWVEMKRVCLGLLIQCSHSPDPAIVAMATAKLHFILQCRELTDLEEIGYLVYRLNAALENAIEVGNSEEYSFLIPVMKALLGKSENLLGLAVNVPDLPSLTSGPIFFQDFQMYSCSKQWRNFLSKRIKPLYDLYQKEIESTLWEPLNTFWAECYEACKTTSKLCKEIEMESRLRFQEKVIVPWRQRQNEEALRQNSFVIMQKNEDMKLDKQYRNFKRIFYGPRGPWHQKGTTIDDFWQLSKHENLNRMRLKLEPNLYHNPHIIAANLRDNTTIEERRLSADFGSSIIPVALLDITAEDDFVMPEEDLRFSQDSSLDTDVDREKIIISQECELIVLMSRIKGRLEVTSSSVTFIDLNPSIDNNTKYDFKFAIALLKEIHLRKYNLRRSALEMFLVDQTSYFLNLTTKTRNKVFSKILGLQPPNIQYGSGRSPSELLKSSGLTVKWVNREISNFDYLMNLNIIAGRTHNDLSQYPIFPWILADYTSEILDLTDPKTYRDLSKPIGVVNPKNEIEVRNKYENFEDPSGIIPKFHYGTHYSNSAGVLHYLLRIEPFTSLHVELQSGRFDVADRQFHSIAQTWKQLMDSPNDVKELIPEFFYFPDFLKNINKLDLGILQTTKESIDDVLMPPWAKKPEDFISIHRRALESEYVSQNLHHWIDLIFGYKQKGKSAVEALNVFYYCSYEGAVDLDKIPDATEREAVEGMINNFGQTPSQLLREPHPKRLSQEECLFKLLKNELKRPDMMQYLDRVTNVTCEMSNERDPVVYLSVPRTPQRSFLQTGPDLLFSITKNGIISCHSWLPQDKDKGFFFEMDPNKNKKQLIGPFHPDIKLSASLFAINAEGKLLYAGGIWDNSLKVFSINKCKPVASVIQHTDVITCIALDNCGLYLVSGSKDCTMVIWSITNFSLLNANQSTLMAITNSQQNLFAPVPLKTLYGHDDAISCVAIMTELDLVVSGSMDGTVNVHTIEEGQYIRTLNPIGCTGMKIEISFLTISYLGHVAFSALDDTSYSVHVFTINGSHIGSKYVSGRVTALTTITEYLIVSDDAGDITISRLNGLKPVFDIPLHIPIETIVITPSNTHILAPIRDGKLAVVGVSMISNKKHSILNV